VEFVAVGRDDEAVARMGVEREDGEAHAIQDRGTVAPAGGTV
jgi:hypothetical protein